MLPCSGSCHADATLAPLSSPLPARQVLTVLLKWIILWRLKPGTYALWGWQYIRWWTIRAVYGQVRTWAG